MATWAIKKIDDTRVLHLPSGDYVDITLDDYQNTLGYSGFVGGASWFFERGSSSRSFVVPIKTAREVRETLETGETVRAFVKYAKHDVNYHM